MYVLFLFLICHSTNQSIKIHQNLTKRKQQKTKYVIEHANNILYRYKKVIIICMLTAPKFKFLSVKLY